MGIETTHYGSVLVPVLMSKLPDGVRVRITRENRDEAWEINRLMNTIQKEVEAREASEGARILTPRPAIPPRNTPNGNGSSASSLITNTQNIKCVYCGEIHYSAACKKVTNVKERKEILKHLGRCFNCLKPNHRARDCNSCRNCHYCHHRHHQLLCESRPTENAIDTQEQVTSTQDTTVNAINTVKSRQLVLLQMAQVEATNSGESKIESVRVLSDNGSQRSYITDSLKTRLGLSSIRKKRLNLNTFGNSKFKPQSCDVVKVYLRKPGNDDVFCVEALSFPTICSALPSSIDLSDHPVLNDLELADYNGNTGQNHIDILVESDFYWSLVTGEIVCTESGPIAVGSKFGWLVSGPVGSHVTGS